MEEIQKKTKKVNNTKKDTKTSKPRTTAKKDVEISKTETTTKKAKASDTEKDSETKKATTTAKSTKASKVSKEKKTTTTTKSAKASNAKKTTKTSKASVTKKENIPLKPSNKKTNTSSKKKDHIIEQAEENKVKSEPKLTVVHNEKKEQNIIYNNMDIKKEKTKNRKIKKEKDLKEKQPKEKAKKEKDLKEEQPKEKAKKEKDLKEKQPKEKAKKGKDLNEKATEEKNKEQKENKAKKENKRYIDISIGAILGTSIIVALLILNIRLGVRAYNMITRNENTDYENEGQNNISVTQEVGNIVDRNNQLVEDMKEKITFAPNVVASIYNVESFSANTIPNSLKLRIGWANVKDENKLKSINEKNEDVEAIEKEKMEESIKNILGPKVQCKHEDFENTNVSTFSTHAQNKGTIYYSDGLYKSIGVNNIEEGISPLIYQEMQKVVKYNEKVIVYVRVAYMDAKENKYIVYRDFSDNKFEEQLSELTPEELFGNTALNQYTGEGTVSSDPNNALDSIRDQLDTYKYTFTLDQETGTYYLSRFNKAVSIQ